MAVHVQPTCRSQMFVHDPYSFVTIVAYELGDTSAPKSPDSSVTTNSSSYSSQDDDNYRDFRSFQNRIVKVSTRRKGLDPAKYKTVLCKYFEKNGKCPFGNGCAFLHGRRERE